VAGQPCAARAGGGAAGFFKQGLGGRIREQGLAPTESGGICMHSVCGGYLMGGCPRGRMCVVAQACIRMRGLAAIQKLLSPAQQAACAQNRGRQCFAALQQIGQGDGFAAFDAVQQTEIGRGEQADVVGVLAVDAFKTLGDHQLHAREFFSGGAVFA